MTYPTLVAAIPRDDFSILLDYGTAGKRVYDFTPNLEHKFYAPLADVNLFKKLTVADGQPEWITGQDFCPHTLYEQSVKLDQSENLQ
jgi:hypothetical protein